MRYFHQIPRSQPRAGHQYCATPTGGCPWPTLSNNLQLPAQPPGSLKLKQTLSPAFDYNRYIKSMKEPLVDSLDPKALSSGCEIARELNKLHLQCTSYLARGQAQSFDLFERDSLELFRNAGLLFESENERRCAMSQESYQRDYGQEIAQLDNLFKTFCMMKAQVKRVKKANNNIGEMFYKRNLLRRVFKTWAEEQRKQRYLQQMQDYCEAYSRRTTAINVLKEWNNITMTQNRLRIRNGVLKKTESELSRVQREYQTGIKGLQQILEKKLLQLRKEEDEHKLLHDKYQSMYERRKYEQRSSQRS